MVVSCITNKKVARVVTSQQIQNCGGLGCPAGELLPEPYILQVLDADGNGIPNVFVQWLVVTGKGELKQFSPAAAHPIYKTAINDDKPYKYCYEQLSSAQRCSDESNKSQWKLFKATNDEGLPLLGKAMMAYNRGTSGLDSRSYFGETDTGLKGPPAVRPTKFGYWMSIKKHTQAARAVNKGYIPYVSYIWKGGRYVAPDPKAGQEWCFVYGEKEWKKMLKVISWLSLQKH